MWGVSCRGFSIRHCLQYPRWNYVSFMYGILEKSKVFYGAFYRISVGYFMWFFVKVILPAHPPTPVKRTLTACFTGSGGHPPTHPPPKKLAAIPDFPFCRTYVSRFQICRTYDDLCFRIPAFQIQICRNLESENIGPANLESGFQIFQICRTYVSRFQISRVEGPMFPDSRFPDSRCPEIWNLET